MVEDLHQANDILETEDFSEDEDDLTVVGRDELQAPEIEPLSSDEEEELDRPAIEDFSDDEEEDEPVYEEDEVYPEAEPLKEKIDYSKIKLRRMRTRRVFEKRNNYNLRSKPQNMVALGAGYTFEEL